MKPESKRKVGPLIRAVAMLQLKLLIGAGRDLLLSPITLAAALIDLVRIKNHEPQFFRSTLKIGERTEEWIDLWSHARDDDEPRENVDKLLARVEEVVRDPQNGCAACACAEAMGGAADSTRQKARSGPHFNGDDFVA